MDLSIESPLADVDRRRLLHPFTSIAEHLERGPFIVTEGRGIRVRDADGNEYIDAMAGLWCVAVGYGREELAETMAAQARKLCYYHEFMSASTEPAILLAERLVSMAPGRMSKVFYGNSGSDANDTFVKLIWLYNNLRGKPQKKKLIARRGAYHGATVASASLTGLAPFQAGFDIPLPRFLHVEKPHHYWLASPGMSERDFSASLARELEETIVREDPETVAAFFAEPVMGAGGVVVPPEGYFDAIVPVLKKYDVLFVADEVICGFGRLGERFGSCYYGIEPDLMTVAKGLTSGYVPLSACLISEPIWEVLRDASKRHGPLWHGFTYSGHPLPCAVALANLDILEREQLVANAKSVGEYFQRRLRELFSEHPYVGEVRGIGLIAGVELVADKRAKRPFDSALEAGRRLHELCKQEGLITRPIGNTMAFSPPLIVSRDDIENILSRFRRGLDRLSVDPEAPARASL